MKLTKLYYTLAIVGLLLTSGVATYITMAEEAPQGDYQTSRRSTGDLDLELNTGVGYKVPYGAISWAGYKQKGTIDDWGTRKCWDLGPKHLNPPTPAALHIAFGEFAMHGGRNHDNTAKWALETIARVKPEFFAETGRGRATGKRDATDYEVLYVAYCDFEVITAAMAYAQATTEFSTPEDHPWWRSRWTANDWPTHVRLATKKSKYLSEPAMSEVGAEIILSQTLAKVRSLEWYVPDNVDDVYTLFGGPTPEFCRLHEAKPRRIAKELREACDE